jgi:C1A family cysteine protease
MAHNDNSDMDRDEVGFKLGLRQMEDRRMLQAFDEEPRRLSTLGTAVNHTAYTLPVDDQGYCGSCWAVAGNTVLEATIALRDTTAGGVVTKLSDQMPVDCSHESELHEMIMGFDLYDYWQFGCWGGH